MHVRYVKEVKASLPSRLFSALVYSHVHYAPLIGQKQGCKPDSHPAYVLVALALFIKNHHSIRKIPLVHLSGKMQGANPRIPVVPHSIYLRWSQRGNPLLNVLTGYSSRHSDDILNFKSASESLPCCCPDLQPKVSPLNSLLTLNQCCTLGDSALPQNISDDRFIVSLSLACHADFMITLPRLSSPPPLSGSPYGRLVEAVASASRRRFLAYWYTHPT
eukprot:766643-Hanusia_phi.AAC.4